MNTLSCYGSGQEVTGSKYIVEGNRTRILVDCGIYQGENATELNKDSLIQVRKDSFDAVVLTHAHLDHIGFLPFLFRKGFEGKVFCTSATKDLAKILWIDNCKIMSKETPWFYTEQDVKKALAHMSLHEFHSPFSYAEFKITFYNAGHILGAASPLFEWDNLKLQISGDLGRDDDLLIKPPAKAQAKTVVMESTYGDRTHPRVMPLKEFGEIFQEALEQDGTVIIPAFSNARSQNLMFFLQQVFEEFPESKLPVFIDSPMTLAISELYEKYPDQLKTKKSWLGNLKKTFQFIEFSKQRKKLASNMRAKVILTASGMLTGGYVMEHLKNFIELESTQILIVGFQSSGTLGAKLIEDSLQVEIDEKLYSVNAKIHNFSHFSSHRDQAGLLDWIQEQDPARIFLTHGETEAQDSLAQVLESKTKHQIEKLQVGSTYKLV